jgi:hypothetical protein
LQHFKSGLFGFTGDLFYTFCTLSLPTYGNQTGPKTEKNPLLSNEKRSFANQRSAAIWVGMDCAALAWSQLLFGQLRHSLPFGIL